MFVGQAGEDLARGDTVVEGLGQAQSVPVQGAAQADDGALSGSEVQQGNRARRRLRLGGLRLDRLKQNKFKQT